MSLINNKDQYRLIWFQHLHKAGGTSIVQLAVDNGENLYPWNGNGNPLDSTGKIIPLWKYDDLELKRFIDFCQTNEITFVATEYGAPDFSYLQSDPRVCLITCMREPLDRFISDYTFAYYRGDTNVSTLKNYVNQNLLSSMFNYYCRIFSRLCETPEKINVDQFETARSNLALFKCCAILGKKSSFKMMFESLEWNGEELHLNQTKLDTMTLLRLLVKGKFSLLGRRMKNRTEIPDQRFLDFFSEENLWDLKLYNEQLNNFE